MYHIISDLVGAPTFTVVDVFAACVIAMVYIILVSLIKEPQRQQFNAIVIGGASATYLSGGLGPWEFAFCVLVTFLAYKGIKQYSYLGIAWLLHTGWDILHHLYGNPIVPFYAASSIGCAICDPIIAIWFFAGAPNVFELFRGKRQLA